jgi:hypothetical protein
MLECTFVFVNCDLVDVHKFSQIEIRLQTKKAQQSNVRLLFLLFSIDFNHLLVELHTWLVSFYQLLIQKYELYSIVQGNHNTVFDPCHDKT